VAWYVNAGGKDVLIDTGAARETIDTYWSGGSEHVQTFEQGLRKLGKNPEDIDYIIATHLHFDHIANARLCKNAKVIRQEAELKFARSPHPLCVGLYPQELYAGLQFGTVTGERDILPGIRVIPAPGHSPGTQAVGVETDKGLAVLSGFCCTNANFDVPDGIKAFWPIYAPGIHTDALAAFDSAVRIKEQADILIPMHEEKFATMEKIPA
jgi:glyoxylase-like metal-dependent hydrolase (beta-lactamase superfamily II)